MIKTYKERQFKVRDKNFQPFKDVLIYDIETAIIDKKKKISAENSKLKIWGAYSYNTGKLYMGTSASLFQELLNSHKVIVGHNIKDFDNKVMSNEGCKFEYGKHLILDTLEILRSPPSKAEKEAIKKKNILLEKLGKPLIKIPIGKGRAKIIGEFRQIGMKDNRLPDFKLATIAKHCYKIFKDNEKYSKYFSEFKDEDFDYDILNKEDISQNEWVIIKEYLRKDIIVTKQLFEFLEKYFEPLTHFISDNNILNLDYIHAPTGSYGYKSICYKLGWEEEYGEGNGLPYTGAYVYFPIRDKYSPKDGNGRCKDFRSQHPSHEHSANLFTPVEKCLHKGKDGKCPNPYSGDGKIFRLKGTYCSCEKGPIEQFISDLLDLKVKYKKEKDPREFTVKIIINSVYGISASPIFKKIYYKYTAPDTTLMSQQSTKFMAEWVQKHGYVLAYGDTDSIYVFDPFKDDEKLNKIIAEGIKQIKDAMPFSDDRYDMTTDAKFTHMFFFKDEKSGEYKKKNYIYITDDEKIKILGLPIIKMGVPQIAKDIFEKYLQKEIIRRKKITFDKDYLSQLIKFEVEKDRNILAVKLNCKPFSTYASENNRNAQISKHYLNGDGGVFYGIKHTSQEIGIGKSQRYCSVEESKRLRYDQLDLHSVWDTLDPFVKKDKQLGIFDF